MAGKSSSRRSARDRILEAASELFYQEGVNTVGIDRIIAESGVAKMSLYNNFESKDALIAAYLEQFDQTWLPSFQAKVGQRAEAPRDRLLAMFDVFHDWFQQPDFRGCAFVNASIELANPNHPGYHIAVQHKQQAIAYIQGLAEAAALDQPATLAQQLAILMEGAIAVALMGQGAVAAEQAKAAAAVLIEAREAIAGV